MDDDDDDDERNGRDGCSPAETRRIGESTPRGEDEGDEELRRRTRKTNSPRILVWKPSDAKPRSDGGDAAAERSRRSRVFESGVPPPRGLDALDLFLLRKGRLMSACGPSREYMLRADGPSPALMCATRAPRERDGAGGAGGRAPGRGGALLERRRGRPREARGRVRRRAPPERGERARGAAPAGHGRHERAALLRHHRARGPRHPRVRPGRRRPRRGRKRGR